MERSDDHITGGSFIPIVLDCPLLPGANPANARIEFVYEANDPGAIGQMTLAASTWYGTNAWAQNTLDGRIRIWTKNADQNRNPASVASGGDFVPSCTLLPFQVVATSAATQIVFYVEEIGTSPRLCAACILCASIYPIFPLNRYELDISRCIRRRNPIFPA